MSDDIKSILETSPTIAILGAHPQNHRPAFWVPDYLFAKGYRALPVNPRFVGETLFGERVVATLAELEVAVDGVNVFRNPAHIPAHIPQLLAMSPRPRWVWFQPGARPGRSAQELESAGMRVIVDRCTYADHRAFGLGRPEGEKALN
jgi:predicted CoA-binding protein